MEKNRKGLKITSIILLIFAGSSILNILGEMFFGEINNIAVPDGGSVNILLITKLIILAVSALLLWPQVYIGIKGLRVAKAPNASKGHIFWAIALFIFSVLGLISPTLELLREIDVYQNVGAILSILVEACLYFEYIRFAKAIAKEN